MFDRIVRTFDGNMYMVNERKGIVSVMQLRIKSKTKGKIRHIKMFAD